jgi:hypothetical protein
MKPRYDKEPDWMYEWGRQYAVVAPRGMRLLVKGKANPKAVALLGRLFENSALV